MKHPWKPKARRGMALALAAALGAGLPGAALAAGEPPETAALPAREAVPVKEDLPAAGSARRLNIAHGETCYATLDYYGGVLDSSVVKSYKTYGNDVIMDYGVYDEVINLTDDLTPTVQNGTVTFRLGEDAPSRFYFEGKTKKPLEEFPWTLSLSYRLNGEPVLAEALAGEKGVVELLLDAVPNPAASEYSRNNVVLTAMSTFNGDDILSLEAEGAQLQQIGNLYCVLFMVMPGEERHYAIRVGTEAFTCGGMVFLAVPATLDQLSQIADLREAKEKAEDSYDAVQDSMDAILDALEGMSGNLSATANGLDQINSGRETLSNGKNAIYGDADTMRADLEALALLLEPVPEQIEALRRTVTDSRGILNDMVDTAVSLKRQLRDMEDALENLEDGKGDVEDLVEGLTDMEGSLRRLELALRSAGGGSSGGGTEPEDGAESSRKLVKKVKAVHRAYEESDLTAFMSDMLLINGTASSDEEALTMAGQLVQLTALSQEQAQALGRLENWQTAQGLKQLHDLARSGASFQAFCQQLPGVSREEAKQMNDLWIVYESGKLNAAETPPAGTDPGSGADTEAGTDIETGTAALSLDAGQELLRNALLLYTGEEGGGADVDSGGEASGAPAPDGGDPSASGGDESASVGGAAIDLITSGLDSASEQMSRLERKLNSAMSGIAGPTADVVDRLADLCDQLNDVKDLLDDAEDLSAAVRKSSKKLREILERADALRNLLNGYEPELQETLATVGSLADSAARTIRDTEAMLGDVEGLMKRAGNDLDPGLDASLKGLASVLRRTTRALDETDSIRDALDTIDTLVRDEWDSHTGEDNNLLLMDASARPVSLTDPRNEGTTSIQYVMRSQEIQEKEADSAAVQTEEADQGTFWSRITAMFRDIWQTVIGWF